MTATPEEVKAMRKAGMSEETIRLALRPRKRRWFSLRRNRGDDN